MMDEMRRSDVERDFPEWHFWAGVNDLAFARRPKTSPPVTLRGEDWTDLRDQLIAWYREHPALAGELRVTHYTPEEPDQPDCDADVDAAPGTVMWGTLNPGKVTCPDCLRRLASEPVPGFPDM